MDDKKPGAARTGGLVVRQDGRKPLFANATKPESRIPALSRSKSSPGLPSAKKDKMMAGPASPAVATSPGGSRIPRSGGRGFGQRKPMSLTEAYKLAGEEDGSSRPGPIDGSPSPAPRSWRSRPGAADEARRKMLSEDHLDTKATSPNKARIDLRNRVDDGIGKSRTSRWVLEEGMRQHEDVPLPSTENIPPGLEASPEKSYAWQVDEDFTAGDLQVSDSPRIKVNQPRSASPKKGTTPNTKLDEIRARELGLAPSVAASPIRRSPTKINDIRAREQEADKQVPLLERGFPRIGAGHTKLDDIRKLETEGLTRRQIAQAKLEEIKERNSMTRSISPDERRPWANEHIPRSKSAFEPYGRQVPDTPVTIYKSNVERVADEVRRAAERKAERKEVKKDDRQPPARDANALSPQKREQSRDLLRKLAHVTSFSPAAEPRDEERPTNPATTSLKADAPRASSLKRTSLLDGGRRRTSNTSNTSKNTSSSDRPTVGFAGLRSRSTDSRKSKRSSMHSEQDPTDRIEAEERLFAPMDNYSERGSVRAPSPLVDDSDGNGNEATPRPASKLDLKSMPTPRAPGAYVETPVTVKKDDKEVRSRRASLESSSDVKPTTIFRDEKPSLAWRSRDLDTASDPGAGDDEKLDKPVRARSLPRRRPLRNSAKLPSVRDDLRELQRIHNIDDNTLDNLEEILLGKKSTSEKLDKLLQEIPVPDDLAAEIKQEQVEEMKDTVKQTKPTKEPAKPKDIDMDKLDDELAAYEKLSQSVERDILGPKAGKPKQTHEKHQHDHDKPTDKCPLCIASPATHTVAYLHLPFPRLFYRSPRLRFTFLGLLLCVTALWYAAESAMCGMYCRPTTCSGPEPCVWSFDDPTSFGSALPVKLDQWTTGGYGRIAWGKVSEEVGDWAADMLDSLHGVRLEDVDVESMTLAQRKRYRRRLVKRGGRKNRGMSAEQRAKVEAWRRERVAKERVARERGRDVYEQSVGEDERVWY